jgi:hypothetical protein
MRFAASTILAGIPRENRPLLLHAEFCTRNKLRGENTNASQHHN